MGDDFGAVINEGGEDGDGTLTIISKVTIEDSIGSSLVKGSLERF